MKASAQYIKQIALEEGFNHCGIAQAKPLDEDARRLEKWLLQQHQGSMQYMERHFDLRVDPRKLVPGAESVITILYNYFPATTQQTDGPKIARYAYGTDYHTVIRTKLHHFMGRLQEVYGHIEGRGFVDSAPVLERAWAVQSGLGWVGKNGNLIHKQQGSYFFIATLISDLPVDRYDDPYAKDYCGSCTRCLDACPTQAIHPNKEIDGSKCISYFTIELKEQIIDPQWKGKFDQWVFGCDSCQEVCPWNRFSKPHQEPAFEANPMILHFSTRDWLELTEEQFRKQFKQSPLARAKWSGIQRNLQFLLPDTEGKDKAQNP